jgi:hypothetical protein
MSASADTIRYRTNTTNTPPKLIPMIDDMTPRYSI